MNKKVYFIGIGGIGMSALARFFQHQGWSVAGYDKTPSPLTDKLQEGGIPITFDESEQAIADGFTSSDTLVIYTPAVPSVHPQLVYFQSNDNRVIKRSQALGELAKDKYLEAVAGTHGKSSTSTMAAWYNRASGDQSAILGAISKNFGTNMVMGTGDKLVVEADEFDRSFLQLYPDSAVITAADPDHLDIYGTPEEFKKTFEKFITQIKPSGRVVIKQGLELRVKNSSIDHLTYSLDDPQSDYRAENIRLDEHGDYHFDIVTPTRTITDCHLGLPGLVNLENTIAAVALIDARPLDDSVLKEAIRDFRGIERRFDIHHRGDAHLYMDDYAHHPHELTAMLTSVRALYPLEHITVAFQPHLFSRTQDFYEGFAEALSLADRVILLPIYPAREEPIEGVSSQMIYDLITCEKHLIEREDLPSIVAQMDDLQVMLTAGAGDIDRFVGEISRTLEERWT